MKKTYFPTTILSLIVISALFLCNGCKKQNDSGNNQSSAEEVHRSVADNIEETAQAIEETVQDTAQRDTAENALKPTPDANVITEGYAFPELTFTALNGYVINLADYKDKVVLIDFWATWCGPCIATMPDLIETYKEYHDKGFDIIGISLDRNQSQLESYMEENGITWPQYYDGLYWNNKIAKRFGINAIPHTVIINKNGEVYYDSHNKGALKRDELEDMLVDLLNTPYEARGLDYEDWEVVSSPDKDIDSYRSVVEKAQKVVDSDIMTHSTLRTFGVGQYRIGAYTEALKTLNNAEKIRTDNNLEPDPYNVAFIAMTQYNLDQVEEGRSAINSLRDSFEELRLSGKLSLFIEAEKVFAGTNEQLITIWDLIDAKELDLAIEKFTEVEQSIEDNSNDFAFSLEEIPWYLSRAVYNRGKNRLLNTDQGYIDRASEFEAAIRFDPNYVSALKDLAWLQTTCRVEEVRDFTKAVDHARLACELTNWENHECLSVFAAACSENEQFAESIRWQQKAIDLLSEDQAEWASNYQEYLLLYQSNLPYSAGTLWSFTEGEQVSFWDFNDDENGIVNNRIDGGSQVMLADEGSIVDDIERGKVLDLHESSVKCTQESDFDITGAISMSAWFKLRPSKEGYHVIFSKSEKDERGWAMYARAGSSVGISINVRYRLGPIGYLPVIANTDLKNDHWYHVVGTYDGGKACVYIDGKLGNQRFIEGNIATNNGLVIIGDNPEWSVQGQDWSWNGLIDDVRIFSYALSPEEVEMLYRGEEPPMVKKLIRN